MEQRKGFGLFGSLLMGMIVVALAIASGIVPFRQVVAQEATLDLARRQRDALIEENRRLEEQVAALLTTSEVERIAREQFGLVKPGEIAYVAESTPEAESTLPGPPTALPERTSWWRELWDFITGRDLLSDG
ncbi:MAG: septum formation initiator family protein [Acidimicrobiia bacterium]|nr:MAG: septum formation initiator family protein [Acidimicrobiia bacterium]